MHILSDKQTKNVNSWQIIPHILFRYFKSLQSENNTMV